MFSLVWVLLMAYVNVDSDSSCEVVKVLKKVRRGRPEGTRVPMLAVPVAAEALLPMPPAPVEVDRKSGRTKGRTRGRGIDGAKSNQILPGQERKRHDFEPYVKVMIGEYACEFVLISIDKNGRRIMNGLADVVRHFSWVQHLSSQAVRNMYDNHDANLMTYKNPRMPGTKARTAAQKARRHQSKGLRRARSTGTAKGRRLGYTERAMQEVSK